jgi:hypothetical protein
MSPIEPKQEKEAGKIYKSTKFDDYEVENFARSLMEAEEIKADPEKLKLAKMCLDKKASAATNAKASLEDMMAEGAEMEMEEEYEGEDSEEMLTKTKKKK